MKRHLEKWIDLRGEVWVRDVGMEFKAMKLKEITRGVGEQESKDKPCSLLTFVYGGDEKSAKQSEKDSVVS